MSFDFSLIWNSLPLLLAGAGVTIEITAIAVGLGFIFGLITSVCRLSGVKILQVIAVCYVNIIRGTPMLVQIFLIYFALPMVIGERINLRRCCRCLLNQQWCLRFGNLPRWDPVCR